MSKLVLVAATSGIGERDQSAPTSSMLRFVEILHVLKALSESTEVSQARAYPLPSLTKHERKRLIAAVLNGQRDLAQGFFSPDGV